MELKKDIKSELEKIKQMSGKDRIWYIYEYYKFHIVAVILAFTLLWVVGSSLYRQTFTTRLTFAIVNDRSGGESSMDEFENSLKEALGFGKKDLIEINSGLFINADGSQSSAHDKTCQHGEQKLQRKRHHRHRNFDECSHSNELCEQCAHDHILGRDFSSYLSRV